MFMGLQAGPQGGIRFDPKVIHIRELRGVNGYTLLAQEIDNQKGLAKFLLVALNGLPQRAGLVMEMDVDAIGGTGAHTLVSLDLDKIFDQEMHEGRAQVENGSVWLRESEILSVARVLATPQPVRQGQAVQFIIQGTGIKEMSVSVFGLNGIRIMENISQSNQLDWDLLNQRGQVVANGVYFYFVLVRGFDGKIFKSKVQKLVVTR